MISLLNRGEHIIIFQYNVLNLTYEQINTILNIKLRDMNYMNQRY